MTGDGAQGVFWSCVWTVEKFGKSRMQLQVEKV